MKQVLGIKNETACMKVTPPLAVAPLAHGNDMRWNQSAPPLCDGGGGRGQLSARTEGSPL